jgi:hypothetical protein
MKAFKKSIFFKTLAFIGLIAPIIALLIVKKDVYFIKGETVKLSIGCMLTLVFGLLCFLGKVKNLNGIIVLAIIWVLTFLMKSLVDDILIIIPCCIAGLVIYNIFNHFYKHYHEIYLIQRNAKIDQVARQEVKIVKNSTGGIV